MKREDEIEKEAKNKYPYIKGLPQTVAHQEIFIEGAKWADESMLKKSREWVKNAFTGVFGEGLANSIADEFVKAMKGE